jgi:hypothetical protein
MHIIRTGTRVVLTLIALTSLMPDRVASAQSIGRFEVGGQVSALRLDDIGATPAGFGGRVSYEFRDWLSVESELNLFPREAFTIHGVAPNDASFGLVHRRQRTEMVFGPKVGMRTERFGLFAKVRPGFARLTDQSIDCRGDVCAAVLLAVPVDRTEFALDLGGVFEFYPSARIVARVDLGDTMIRRGSLATPSCSNCTSHNVASRVGIGLRF